MAKTATGSTADMREENVRHWMVSSSGGWPEMFATDISAADDTSPIMPARLSPYNVKPETSKRNTDVGF